MKVSVLGEKKNPAILMLNGTLCSGDGLRTLGSYLAADYYVILPTYDGCDGSGTVYESGEIQARKILDWLQEQEITSLELAHGTSMGGEVLMAFVELAESEGYPVKQYFFDGGPFFRFPKWFQAIMNKKFQYFAQAAKGHDDKEGIDKMLVNPMIRKLIGDDTEAYREMIGDMAHVCQTVDAESIRNMTKTCYDFRFPAMTPELQKKFYFLWGEREMARRSEKKIRRVYPNARFRIVTGYMHCGYQVCAPERYVQDLKVILSLLT